MQKICATIVISNLEEKKKAWKCKHVNAPHYALGQCHNCYQIHHLKNIKEKVDFDIDDIYS